MVSFNNLTFHFAKGKKKQRILMSELCLPAAGERGDSVCGREKGFLGGHQFWLGLSACLGVSIEVRDVPVLISSVCISLHSAKLCDSRIPLGLNFHKDFFFSWLEMIDTAISIPGARGWGNMCTPPTLCSWTLYPVGFQVRLEICSYTCLFWLQTHSSETLYCWKNTEKSVAEGKNVHALDMGSNSNIRRNSVI